MTELPKASDLAAWRAAKDDYLANHRTSPLYGEEGFSGLSYFPETEALRVVAQVERPPESEPVMLSTSTGDERLYLTYGTARFELNGVTQSLVLYATPDAPAGPRLFVPFRDATSGSLTYGAGRYLEVTLEHEGQDGPVLLDFNYAYHPYCAYVEGYSCPFPPMGNWLEQPVPAGERLTEPHGGADQE